LPSCTSQSGHQYRSRIVSWLLHRYVAPQSWREWTCASLVQAFIIALFGWGDLGAALEMLVGYTVLIISISLLIEGWREVYLATQAGQLATNGFYAVVRHPYYSGICLALFGQMIHLPTIPTLVLFPVIVWAYYRLAKREERQMLERFGAQYAAYQQQVPMFFPKLAGNIERVMLGRDYLKGLRCLKELEEVLPQAKVFMGKSTGVTFRLEGWRLM
jgi:protein-S-isoprenylcysteine O-methyltransferase Ste14